jgi:hypothetical protein
MKYMLKTFPKNTIVVIILLIMFIGCKSGNECLDQTVFIELYARLSIINEMQINTDLKQKLAMQLFDQHSTTEACFKQTVNFYHQSPEEWIVIIEKVKKRMRELKELYQPKGSQKKDAATDDRTDSNQPQSLIMLQRQDPGDSHTRPDSSTKRRRR